MRIEVSINVDVPCPEGPKPGKPHPDKPPALPGPASPPREPKAPTEAGESASLASLGSPGKLMGLRDVMMVTGASRYELDGFVAQGRLPNPIRRGKGLFWPAESVQLFLLNRKSEAARKRDL